MQTKIQKWGNSLGLRIPSAFADEVAVQAGSTVDLTMNDGCLMIRPVAARFELRGLLAEVSDENLHGEVDTGGARGREAW